MLRTAIGRAVALVLATSLPALAGGEIVNVPGDFPTIQAAIDGTGDRVEIYVDTSLYRESDEAIVADKFIFRLYGIGESRPQLASAAFPDGKIYELENVHILGDIDADDDAILDLILRDCRVDGHISVRADDFVRLVDVEGVSLDRGLALGSKRGGTSNFEFVRSTMSGRVESRSVGSLDVVDSDIRTISLWQFVGDMNVMNSTVGSCSFRTQEGFAEITNSTLNTIHLDTTGGAFVTDCTVGGSIYASAELFAAEVERCTVGGRIFVGKRNGGNSVAVRDCVAASIELDGYDQGTCIATGNLVLGDGEGVGVWVEEAANATIAGNLVVGFETGVHFEDLAPSVADISCNDVWDVTVGWSGIDDPTGTNGNVSANPLLCGNEDPREVHPLSPCRLGNHPDGASCGNIGGVVDGDCQSVPTLVTRWSSLKALFDR